MHGNGAPHMMGKLHCTLSVESWPLKTPFRIAGATMHDVPVLLLELRDAEGRTGRGEAAGVDYAGETPYSMAGQIAAIEDRLHAGLSGEELLRLLPIGGARNALDCALWDLRAKQSGRRVWQLAGLPAPNPLLTALTIGLGDDDETRAKARAAADCPLLKIKVDAERHIDAVRIVRECCPRARLIIDANGAWQRRQLETLLPAMQAAGVELVEQPLAAGDDEALDGLRSAIPLAADESCTDRQSLRALAGRYQYINIKLDKCGGLTEALLLAERASALGFGLMVGNMCGTSLAMAPAFLLGQLCRYVDLDGPQLQLQDRAFPMPLIDQRLQAPVPELWG